MNKVSLLVIGAGNRGYGYASVAGKRPDLFTIAGVADPNDSRRNQIKEEHGLDESACFRDWRDVLSLPRMADCALICTQDHMHFEPAMAAIEKGYHILLEKPISPDPQECLLLTEAAERKGVQVIVCHVLRYTPFYGKVKELIESGRIGEVVSMQHIECVAYYHQAHSFVRGNWSRKEDSSPMILAKCCHDMDLMQWLIGKKCMRVSSFGSLTHFTKENMPKGAPVYCIEGCPHGEECPYNAVKLYYDDKENKWFRTTSTLLAEPTDEDVKKAITTGPYGRCVYQCDNNVVDHQVVNLEYEGGVTASFTMCAFTPKMGRISKIMGTKGELNANMDEDGVMTIDVTEFQTKTTEQFVIDNNLEGQKGHGGGDEGIMLSLYETLNGVYSGNAVSTIRTSCENHMVAFAAEESRINNQTIFMDGFE